jgi:hypothetical protein
MGPLSLLYAVIFCCLSFWLIMRTNTACVLLCDGATLNDRLKRNKKLQSGHLIFDCISFLVNETFYNGALIAFSKHTFYEETVVVSFKSNLLLMSFCLHIINYNS